MLSGWRPPPTWLRGVPLLWLIQAEPHEPEPEAEAEAEA
jgi:hypothetical protein